MNSKNIIKKIKALTDDLEQEAINSRRFLHAHPELSFEEHETARFIASKLKEMGIQYKDGIAGNGVIGLIKGKNPQKKIIGIRADMDALPVTEKTTPPFKSKKQGKMHACGHDVHTAMLLGAAKILNELKNSFEGSVMLIFQPAEEKIPGGALQMIQEGAFVKLKPDIIIGQHVAPEMETGTVGFRKGLYMASSDEIYITVTGKGGHAAILDNMNDTVYTAAQIITNLQQVVSRRASPFVPTVLSFGKVKADGAVNVIPGEVYIEGTFRTMDSEWRERAHKLIKYIALNTAKNSGCKCDINIKKGYPVLFNEPELTEAAINAAYEYIGHKNVKNVEMRMSSEDFAYYSQICPTMFYRLGCGNKDKGIGSPLHSATFSIDENCIRIGMGLMVWLTLALLAGKN